MPTIRLLKLWDSFRGSFWFVPLVLVLLAVALSATVPIFDASINLAARKGFEWLATDADTARATLSLLTGTMFTVVGLVFSMTLVTLSITVGQFGPRLLRTFMNDFTTQFALGIFLATGVYCLIVQWIVMTVEGPDFIFVPHTAVAMAVLAAVFSMGALIYFIHHIALLIQAPSLVEVVASELNGAVERLFPERIGAGRPDGESSQAAALDDWRPIRSHRDGYVEGVDAHELMAEARGCDVVVRVLCRPGDFIATGEPLVEVAASDRREVISGTDDGEKLDEALRPAFLIGSQRTPRQDVRFTVRELVEIACRALSPGINDPFTAIACIDRLSAGLRLVAGREIPSPYRYDETGRLRVIAEPVRFDELLHLAFDSIREYGRGSLPVLLSLLEGLTRIAAAAARREDRTALLSQAETVVRAAETGLSEPRDQAAVERAMDRFRQAWDRIKPPPTSDRPVPEHPNETTPAAYRS